MIDGEGEAAPATKVKRPKAPSRDVPFIRRWLHLGPFDNPKDALLDEPKVAVASLAPRNGSTTGGLRWRTYRSLRPELELGGRGGPHDWSLTYPFWRGADPDDPAKSKDYLPNPGTFGRMALHAPWRDRSAFAYWKVRVPEVVSELRIRVSSVPRTSGDVDAVLKVSAFDGELHPLLSETIGGNKERREEQWRALTADLERFSGKEILLVLEAAPGGRHGWKQEGLHFDEIAVRPRR